MALLYVYYGKLLKAVHSGKEFPERVAERLQASVNIYVGGLVVTGGGWKHPKFHWWPIGLKWKDVEYYYLWSNKFGPEIYLPGISEDIKELYPDEANEGMGVFTVPDS